MTTEQSFASSIVFLLRELLEGKPEGADWTWIVEGEQGLLFALGTVDAATASVKPTGTASSIAGHANHILYLLRLGNSHFGSPEPEGDWDSSWLRQTVEPQEWDRMRSDIESEYRKMLEGIEGVNDWSMPDFSMGVSAQLAHIAYHLGAVWQQIRTQGAITTS